MTKSFDNLLAVITLESVLKSCLETSSLIITLLRGNNDVFASRKSCLCVESVDFDVSSFSTGIIVSVCGAYSDLSSLLERGSLLVVDLEKNMPC